MAKFKINHTTMDGANMKTVEATMFMENGKYTQFLDSKNNVVYAIPTENVKAIERTEE